MGTIAVEVKDVSKKFRLYDEKYQSLKERVLHAGRTTHTDFWALRDVSFDVSEGETLGILGRNGSGKSTLLKCISGILQPTVGEVRVRGQLAALLELGAGFQAELSGRENVFMNASLLGLSTKEVEKRFDDIVAFAELEQFIDNQVKFYSSGMYVRLGFAVAVNVDPDVLVIDEVLAVGDENFARKCLDRIKEFQDEGRTIIFVTHAADLVRQICDRAVVLSGGKVIGIGGPGEAIRLHRENLLEQSGLRHDEATSSGEAHGHAGGGTRAVSFSSVEVVHPGTGSRPHAHAGEPITIQAAFDAVEALDDVVFSVAVHDTDGNLLFASDTEILDRRIDLPAGPGRVDFRIARFPMSDGTFKVSVGARNRHGGIVYDWRDQQAQFEVVDPGRSTGSLVLELDVDVKTVGA